MEKFCNIVKDMKADHSQPHDSKPSHSFDSFDTAPLESLLIGPNGFAHHVSTGSTYTISETGSIIIAGLQSGLEFNDIVNLIMGAYDVSERDISRHLTQFLRDLESLGLLVSQEKNEEETP